MDTKAPQIQEKTHAIVKRERVSKDGAALEVYSLHLSDEWKKRLTMRQEVGFRRMLRRLSFH